MLPEEHEESLEDVSEVIVSVDGSVWVVGNVPKQLHPDDRVDEEEHHHQHHHVWKSLRPEEDDEDEDGEEDEEDEEDEESQWLWWLSFDESYPVMKFI